jgi:hypothetical protein
VRKATSKTRPGSVGLANKNERANSERANERKGDKEARDPPPSPFYRGDERGGSLYALWWSLYLQKHH